LDNAYRKQNKTKNICSNDVTVVSKYTSYIVDAGKPMFGH